MFNLGSIFVLLGADTSGLNAGERRMTQFANNVNRQFEQVEKNAKRLHMAFIGIGAAAAVKGAVALADEYKNINGRIAQATKATKDYLAVQAKLQTMSMDIGSGFGSGVSLFQNIARAAPEVGKTNKEAMRLTESLLKLSVLSGATGLAMRHAMVQFGQSMAGGIVRAEEWNSIMENTPEIGVRIAKGLGKTVGQLRLAIVDGKVLSKDVFESLLKQSDQIDKDFKDMPRRIHQGFEAMKTGAMSFLGQADSALGVTNALANSFQNIGNYLSGDFSGTIFAIKNDILAMGDGFNTWGPSIQKALSGGEWSQFADVIKFDMAWIWEQIVKLPVHIKILIEAASAGMAAMFLTIKAGIETFQMNFKIAFEAIKMYATLAASWIVDKLAGDISSVFKSISIVAMSAGAVAGELGMEDAANAMNSFAKASDVGKESVMSFADAMKGSADDSVKSIEKMVEETKDIDEAWRGNIKALEENRDASLAASQAELEAIDANRIAREKDFSDKKSMNEAERALAEKRYQEQIAIANKTLGVDPKTGKKTGGGGRSGSSADPNKEFQDKLDALTKSLHTELELENQHYRDSQASLDQAEALGLASTMSYHELRERLEREHVRKLQEVNREGLEGIHEIRQWNAIKSGKVDEQVAAMTTSEQAKTFTTLIDQAAEHNKQFFQLKKAMALATAAIDAPKAILASFAFGSEIGGPVVGAIFGGIAAAAVGVQMGAIAGAQYQGGKATGGEVHSNRMYRVNEQGPEMFSQGGNDFLMMGSKGGHVTPNSKLGNGGGNNVSVNIHNYAGVQVTRTESGTPDNKTIDILLQKLDDRMAANISEGRGKTHKAISGSFNLSRGKRVA